MRDGKQWVKNELSPSLLSAANVFQDIELGVCTDESYAGQVYSAEVDLVYKYLLACQVCLF